MHRERAYALPIHGRNHCSPFFLPNVFPSALSGLTFPLKGSAAARYMRIRLGCFGDILSVIRRRLSWSELSITPIAVCQKHQRERNTHKQGDWEYPICSGCSSRGTSVLMSQLRFLCKSASQAGQLSSDQEVSNLGSLWKHLTSGFSHSWDESPQGEDHRSSSPASG